MPKTSDINLLVKYWRLKNTEISLAKGHFWLTWELDFSQACNFRRMLMNHKNFHLIQISDVVFLKSPKTMFLGHFWPFLVIFARWGFLPKNPAKFQKKLMSKFRENLWTDGRAEGRTNRSYFIGPLRPRPGVQKIIRKNINKFNEFNITLLPQESRSLNRLERVRVSKIIPVLKRIPMIW